MIKFTDYEDERLHDIECNTKFLENEQLKDVEIVRKHGRVIDLDASYPENRKDVNELMSKCNYHQLFHNYFSSDINDGVHSVARNAKFYCDVSIFFPLMQFWSLTFH